RGAPGWKMNALLSGKCTQITSQSMNYSPTTPNQSMKPTAPSQNNFSVFAATLPWLISVSLGLWRTLHEISTLYSCPRPYSGPCGRRARAEREGQSQNKCRGGHQETG